MCNFQIPNTKIVSFAALSVLEFKVSPPNRWIEQQKNADHWASVLILFCIYCEIKLDHERHHWMVSMRVVDVGKP
jgi:hypothetical protein